MASARLSVLGCRRRQVSQRVWRQGSSPPHGPSFAPGRPASSNSRWSELPVPGSGAKRTRTPAARAARRMRPSTPGRGRRDRVGVGHEDGQAARGRVEDADDVAGAPAAGDREALAGGGEAGGPEAGLDVAVGPALGAARGGARADGAREGGGGG